MNAELIQIEEQIEKLKNRKMEIKFEETKKKDKNKNQYNNSPNILARISIKFNNKIDKINEKREEIGFGKLSNPKITELITRHKFFLAIEEDIIHFNPELEEKDNVDE